ncbi:Pentalenene oxygenase [Acaryochloris thomasi RCC1774]|uniref:Pentalenene oxygenase n=1 Tax=Acaryochloris thomasi RCC1774 TaxID=1764569 RepID=A0A2W1JRB2_9CYAN|nr:cytochrome P450 [Acaryochloris thomasi]PZD71397.1 Pentalenene oxygenase [Acaryochloris thomasi RCC1774]
MVLDLSTSSQAPRQSLRALIWNRFLQPLLQRIFRWLTASKAQPFEDIPGPTPIFPTGNVLDFQKDPTWEVLGNYAQQYGNVARFWMLFRPCLAVNDPKLIHQVLSGVGEQSPEVAESRCPLHNNPIYKFYKNQPRKALRPMLTDTNPFEAAAADAHWKDLKQNHPFSMDYFDDWLGSQIEPLHAFIETRATELVAASNQAGELSAYDAIQKLTFDGFSLATVGQVFPDEVFEQFNSMCQTGTSRMTRSTLATWLIPEKPWDRTYRKVSKAWFNRFEQIVSLEEAPANSLLGWVLRKGGTNFEAEKLRNFCAGVYPGGAVSTPSGITSALHLLHQHPETLAALKAEVKDFFAGPLTLERLEGCTQLDQVMRESLRLWPAVPFFLRTVNQGGAELAGHSIPAGTPIFMSNWSLQRLSDHWSEPETFNPARWDAETCRQNDWGSDYFFPFGRGDRACIGQYFARYFMKLVLAVLVSKFGVTFGDQSPEQEFFFGVAVPRQLKAQFIYSSKDLPKYSGD